MTALLDVAGSPGVYSAAVMAGRPGVRAALAERAGFVDVEHRPTAGDRGVLLARKPG